MLIVGGFSTPRAALLPLRSQLRAAGCAVGVFVHRFGMDCGESTFRRLRDHVAELRTRYPEVVALAHSRGGQFVKVLAVRDPDLLAASVALGVPTIRGVDHLGSRTRRRVLGVSRIGDAGVPGLVTSSCLGGGGCCGAFWDDLERPWPASVTVHGVFGLGDAVVDGAIHGRGLSSVSWVPGNHRDLVTAKTPRARAVELVRDVIADRRGGIDAHCPSRAAWPIIDVRQNGFR
ncbi:alpha/beta hydrolase [Nocardia amamiensis]|uniref:alpha/beta hydrolase n=1 Tax=Nocardia amamiensis TaxID=404578 RepID=UPI000836B2C5|nr:alpha/beta hydrolase [Nocardia amamiensis]